VISRLHNHKLSTLNLAVELLNRTTGISTYIPSKLLAQAAAWSQNNTFFLPKFSYTRGTLRKKFFFSKRVDIYTRMQNGSSQHVLSSTDEFPYHQPATKQTPETMLCANTNKNQLFLIACGPHTMLVILESKPLDSRNDARYVTWYDPSHCAKKHHEYEGNIRALLKASFPHTTFESLTKISSFLHQGVLNDCALLAAFAGCEVLKSGSTDVLRKSEAAGHRVILGTKKRATSFTRRNHVSQILRQAAITDLKSGNNSVPNFSAFEL
jgi:hypothetical protein